MVMKIIPASDMAEVSKKKSKIVKKPLGDKLLPGPIKGIVDLDKKPDVGKTVVGIAAPDNKTDTGVISDREIKAIKLKESIYYGPNDINKKMFAENV